MVPSRREGGADDGSREGRERRPPAFFAQRVALTPEQVRATTRGDAADPMWNAEERLLIRLVDQLHDSFSITDELWKELVGAHTVSFFANGLKLAPETFATPLPSP